MTSQRTLTLFKLDVIVFDLLDSIYLINIELHCTIEMFKNGFNYNEVNVNSGPFEQ